MVRAMSGVQLKAIRSKDFMLMFGLFENID